jgi:CheY-like chemotaxis protein
VQPQPRVLVVEDDTEARALLCSLLEGEGYRTVGVGTAREALALLDHDLYDAALMDLGLPEVDGLELLRTMRSRPGRPVAVVFSGFHVLRRAAYEAGCDDFVPNVNKLLSTVAGLLAERRMILKLRKGLEAT